jgi:hypothetical protein
MKIPIQKKRDVEDLLKYISSEMNDLGIYGAGGNYNDDGIGIIIYKGSKSKINAIKLLLESFSDQFVTDL